MVASLGCNRRSIHPLCRVRTFDFHCCCYFLLFANLVFLSAHKRRQRAESSLCITISAEGQLQKCLSFSFQHVFLSYSSDIIYSRRREFKRIIWPKDIRSQKARAKSPLRDYRYSSRISSDIRPIGSVTCWLRLFLFSFSTSFEHRWRQQHLLIQHSGFRLSMQSPCKGALCTSNLTTTSGQCCPTHHCSHRNLARTQSESSGTLRASSTCSLISSPVRSFLDNPFSKEWSACSTPTSPVHGLSASSNGLSVVTSASSLVFSDTSHNLPKNFKCVFYIVIRVFCCVTLWPFNFIIQWMKSAMYFYMYYFLF